MRIHPFFAIALMAAPLATFAQDDQEEEVTLPISGRLTDGSNKLAGCAVVTFIGNEQIAEATTDKSGKFGMQLKLNEVYGIEFRKEGFVPKRMLIDTHVPNPKEGEEIIMAPIDMDVSLLEHTRYSGANTDDLDFPFAIVRFNKRALAFVPDQEYTADMQRTNGALLLMAARSEKSH